MLFDHLVEPGDPVIVEAPSYDRTLLALEARGAERFAVPLQSDGIDVGALEVALAAGLRAELCAHHPQLPQPGRLHAVAGKARAAARACRRVRLL